MLSVLTGDIVGSQALASDQRGQLQTALRDAADFAELEPSFETFGGDRWQAVCEPPHSALHKALSFRAFLLGKKGIDTRVSIGIGSYESLRPEKISLSQGEAFVLSGQGLDAMESDRRLVVGLSPSLPKSSLHFLTASCFLLDALTSEWTAKQAQAVALAQSSAPQYELAQQFAPPISPQAFGKHLASANWKLLKQALTSLALALHVTLR